MLECISRVPPALFASCHDSTSYRKTLINCYHYLFISARNHPSFPLSRLAALSPSAQFSVTQTCCLNLLSSPCRLSLSLFLPLFFPLPFFSLFSSCLLFSFSFILFALLCFSPRPPSSFLSLHLCFSASPSVQTRYLTGTNVYQEKKNTAEAVYTLCVFKINKQQIEVLAAQILLRGRAARCCCSHYSSHRFIKELISYHVILN